MNGSKKSKLFVIVVSICTMMAFTPVVGMVSYAGTGTYHIMLDNQYDSANNGKIEYSLDDGASYTEIAAGDISGNEWQKQLTSGTNTIKIRCTPASGKTLMISGRSESLTNGSYVFDLAADDTSQHVEFNSQQGGGQGTGTPATEMSFSLFVPAANMGTLAEYDAQFKSDYATVEYYNEQQGRWVEINSGTTYNGGRYKFDGAVTSVKIRVTLAAGKVLDLECNGIQGGGMKSGQEYVISGYGQYDIQFSKHQVNVTWAYDDTFGADGKVTNGKVSIVSAKAANGGDGIISDSQDARGGRVVITPGSLVTVKISPDYGYQFEEGSLNGSVITAGSQVSTFTFIMPNTNLHLAALFTKTSDVVKVSGDDIESASVAGGSGVIDSGNLKLSVKSAEPDSEVAEGMNKIAEGSDSEIKAFLEIDLDQVVYKGSKTAAWETPLTELDKPVTVTMEVSDELKNSDGIPTVIREHDGEYSKVASEYDADAGEIEFKADKFSEYAIAYTAAAENTVATPKTGDENGIGGWMAMLLISMGALLMVMKRINTQ